MSQKIRYWLMKSEPNSYSISDLKRDETAFWDGVRNYQARNFMMKNMKKGDKVLFYHSSSNPPGVVGLAIICKEAEADQTAWDKSSQYYDSKATKEKPRWFAVTVQFVKVFDRIISIGELRREKILRNMTLLQKGQRLSVLPVTKTEYQYIIQLSQKKTEGRLNGLS